MCPPEEEENNGSTPPKRANRVENAHDVKITITDRGVEVVKNGASALVESSQMLAPGEAMGYAKILLNKLP